MSETIHHLPSKVGVLVGKEGTHGTKASDIDIIAGRKVVFAESVSENQVEIYDPANGQALQEVVPGSKDVGGSLSFQLVDWRWLYWIMGTVVTDEIYITDEVGSFTTEAITGRGSGFTATISARDGDEFTLTSITGTPEQGETIEDDGTQVKTAVLASFIHDISLGDVPVSLTVQNIFDQMSSPEGENFLGMRSSESNFASTRGEVIPIDLTLVGLDEATEGDPEDRLASTKTPWIWSTGSISLNGVNLDNVCDSVSLKIMRNCVARGGHARIGHQVVPGNFKVEITLEMDLPSSAVRVLRRANTKVVVALDYVNTENLQQGTLTLTNVQILSDIRDTNPDSETVRVAIIGTTGSLTGRIYDDIYAY